MNEGSKSVLVVVPTYNERENLPLLVREIMTRERYRVMVMDDGSPDGTGEVADELADEFPDRVEVVHRTGPRGLGRSYIDGFQRAVNTDADVICQMDADLSHDPKCLPDLVAATEYFDLVIGSRYIPGGDIVNWPMRRRLLSSWANRYIRGVTRLQVRDCTSGFRSWRREALCRMPLAESCTDGYAFLVEMLCTAAGRRLTIGERPITFVERRHGESKLSSAMLFESIVTPWRFAFQKSSKEPRPPQNLGNR